MKKVTRLSILFFLMLAFYTCKKDPGTTDPCEGIICARGNCVNGICECPKGYTGAACQNQVTPTSIRVTRIDVIDFPATDANGSGWDLTSGPDIFITFGQGNSELYTHKSFYQNATPGQTYTFIPTSTLLITNPTGRYYVHLFDYDDFDPDDYMGGIEFTPYNSKNQFPEKIKLEVPSLKAKFELYLQYDF